MSDPSPPRDLTLRNGDKVPMIGLGTWQAEPGVVGQAVQEALEVGYRHIDCAAIYGNEKEIGTALQGAFQNGPAKRDQVWITSKLWNNRHAPDAVRAACEQTLRDLELEHLDLYLMHWPVALRPEATLPEGPEDFVSLDEQPLADTWEAMQQLKKAGLARNVGVSNFSAAKINHLIEATGATPAVNQVELHPYLQQEELLSFCKERGVGVTAYSPLGSPGRSDAMRQANEPSLLADSEVQTIATELGATPAQVLIAWAVQRGTSVIPKSVRRERLEENLAAGSLRLQSDQMARVSGLAREHRYIDGSFWCPPGSPYTLDSLWDD